MTSIFVGVTANQYFRITGIGVADDAEEEIQQNPKPVAVSQAKVS